MVKSNTRLIIAIAAVLVIVGVFAYVSLVEDGMFPGADIDEPALTPEFVVNVTDAKIYGGSTFKVTVTDKATKLPVEKAQVTFVVHQIHALTNVSGVVFFTAPDEIEKLYLLHENDTLRAFPLTVQKAMYKSWTGLVEVHPSTKVDKYMLPEAAELHVVVSYHGDKIYERSEFKVEVSDVDTGVAIEGANISFMIPLIHLDTNKEGFVYFSAPKIQDEYLLHPNDTCRAFSLTVKKEGYNTYTTSVTVHLRE